MTHHRPSRRTALSGAAVAVALAAALAACGGSSSKTGASPTTTAPASTSGSGSASGRSGAAAGGGIGAGTLGTVAQITGSSMEVQSPQNGQETVSWTSSTRFTRTATLTPAALKAGDCVTVIGTRSGITLTARSVVIDPAPSSGSCATGFGAGGRAGGTVGGGGGAFAGRAPGGTSGGGGSSPSTPSRPTSGTRPANLANLGVAAGSVVSVGPTSMVIHGVSFSGGDLGRRAAGSTSPSTPPTTTAATDVTVTLASGTTYTETVSTTPASLAVGDCVLASGPTNSTGAVAASTVRITGTSGQSCTAGFGAGRFGGGFGRSGGATSGTAGGTPANG